MSNSALVIALLIGLLSTGSCISLDDAAEGNGFLQMARSLAGRALYGNAVGYDEDIVQGQDEQSVFPEEVAPQFESEAVSQEAPESTSSMIDVTTEASGFSTAEEESNMINSVKEKNLDDALKSFSSSVVSDPGNEFNEDAPLSLTEGGEQSTSAEFQGGSDYPGDSLTDTSFTQEYPLSEVADMSLDAQTPAEADTYAQSNGPDLVVADAASSAAPDSLIEEESSPSYDNVMGYNNAESLPTASRAKTFLAASPTVSESKSYTVDEGENLGLKDDQDSLASYAANYETEIAAANQDFNIEKEKMVDYELGLIDTTQDSVGEAATASDDVLDDFAEEYSDEAAMSADEEPFDKAESAMEESEAQQLSDSVEAINAAPSEGDNPLDSVAFDY